MAAWQIETRVEARRRQNLGGSEYLEREIDSLETPGSYRLSRLLVAFVGGFLIACGIYAIVRGIG